MKILQCAVCGGQLHDYTYRCTYCGSMLFSDVAIPPEMKEKIVTALRGWEKNLLAGKGHYQGKIAVGCLASFGAFLAICMFIYAFMGYNLLGSILMAVTGVAFFVLFGGIVSKYEEKAMRQLFDKSLKKDIQDYLLAINCPKQSFKTIAFEVLEPTSALYIFLSDL